MSNSRRIEKLTRTVRDIVSDIIQTQLSDPRIRGLTSVTRVKLAADLSTANIYLSVIGVDETQQKLTFTAIAHAGGFIQTQLAGLFHARTCPALRFFQDDSLKKSLEIEKLIDQASSEFKENKDATIDMKEGIENEG